MYQPQEAVKDFYMTKIAILVILIAITLYVFSTVLGTGTKYIILKNFGVVTTGEVVAIKDRRGNDIIDFSSNNYWGLTSRYDIHIIYLNQDRQEEKANFFAAAKEVKHKTKNTFTYELPYEIGNRFSVIYYPALPSVVLPKQELFSFKTDRNLMLGSMIVIALLGLFLVFQIKAFRRFRSRNKYY